MTTPPSDQMIADAAELRAAGAAWDTIAAQIGRAPHTVRQWQYYYRARWVAALRAAESRIASEAAAESVIAMRAQLRSTDPDVSHAAARQLMQYRVALNRSGADANPAGVAPGSEATRVAAHLESLSHDQREQLLDRAVAVVAARRDARGAGSDPTGS